MIIKHLAGKVIDSAVKGIITSVVALWTFFPSDLFTDFCRKSTYAAQVVVPLVAQPALRGGRLAARSAVKTTRLVSKLLVSI